MIAPLILTAIFALIMYFYLKHKKFAASLPPGPPPTLLLGNLLQINRQDPKTKFVEWHKKYGPIYTVWNGNVPNIFVTGHDLLQELFVKRGDEFADRPQSFIFNHFKWQYGITSFSGDKWREQRRFTMHVLKNFGLNGKRMEQNISTECDRFVAKIESSLDGCNQKNINFKPLLDVCVGSIISSVLFGHTYEFGDSNFLELKEGMGRVKQVMTTISVQMLESFPWLRFIPFYKRFGYNVMKAENLNLLNMLSNEVKQHKMEIDYTLEPADFTDAYLLELKRRQESGADMGLFSESQLTAVLGDMWGAALETTVTTLNWAILLMIHHPEIQENVQNEIQDVIGSERMPNMNDRSRMPYACATMHEIQRYANILATNLPHAANKDVEIFGYKIPKGVTFIPQMSVVHLDDSIYSNPQEFNPARFLEIDNKTLKKTCSVLMPFSLGKRVCLGEGLARMELFLIFTNLLHNFSFSFAHGEPETDLTPVASFSSHPKKYTVSVTRRRI